MDPTGVFALKLRWVNKPKKTGRETKEAGLINVYVSHQNKARDI